MEKDNQILRERRAEVLNRSGRLSLALSWCHLNIYCGRFGNRPGFGSELKRMWQLSKERCSPRCALTAAGENLFQPHHVEVNYDPGPLVGIRRGFYALITLTKAR